MSSRERIEIREVDPEDVKGLEAWAARWCRGWTIPDLASAFGIEATSAAIEAYLSEGLDGEAKQAVVKGCRRELEHGERQGYDAEDR
jgi:hypothetical protein